MVEPNDLKLYRNSNLSGEALPLEILLSKGLIKQDFTVTAANAIDLPDDTELLVIYGDPLVDCLIQLDGNAAIPANGAFTAGLHYIPAGSIKTIDCNGAATLGVVSWDGTAGTVVIECAYAYKDARKSRQLSNI